MAIFSQWVKMSLEVQVKMRVNEDEEGKRREAGRREHRKYCAGVPVVGLKS